MMLAYRIEEKGAELHQSLNFEEPVYANSTLLNEVLTNIISDALDAVPEGMGRIEINTLSKKERTRRFVRIEISDKGEGDTEKDLKRIFDLSWRTKFKRGGTGVGPSLSYRMIKNFGGEISVKSKKGKGTVFSIRLPLEWESMGEEIKYLVTRGGKRCIQRVW